MARKVQVLLEDDIDGGEASQTVSFALDGILIGTAAMATLEATTAPEVKQMLVDTRGCEEWIGAGHS